MYKIDWNQYLSHERDRQSTRKVQEEGEVETLSIDSRNDFESDLGRAIFSSAIRRMHDKAQVMPLTSGDSMHTRLTHSLEVMSVAYSLGINVCRNKQFIETYGKEESFELEQKLSSILKTAALLHDIGNPPFGHFGESIIQKYFKDYFEKVGQLIEESQKRDFTEFDGNAQGFRVLTKQQHIGDLNGLNLTFATLGAYVKYPNIDQRKKDRYIGNKKHGVYTSEREVFDKLVYNCGLKSTDGKIKRHPLSFLVEAADSICYNIMDVEDGLNKKWYTFDEVINFLDSYLSKNNKATFSCVNFFQLQDKLSNAVLGDIDKSSKRKMIDFRICVIRYFVSLAVRNFIEHLEEIDKGTYTQELIEDDENNISKAFQAFAQRYIFTREEIQKVELTGVTVITGLLDYLIDYVFNTDSQYRKRAKSVLSKNSLTVVLHELEYPDRTFFFLSDDDFCSYDLDKLDNYHKLRMIVDYISGMTDKYALSLYRQLSGQVL